MARRPPAASVRRPRHELRARAATFRLLDYLVGWDPLDVYRLTDPDAPGGIQLAPAGHAGAARGDFLPWLPDPRLAPGCGRCAWYLATPYGLLRRGSLRAGGRSGRRLRPRPGPPRARARRPRAPAGGRLPEAVYLWRREGDQLVAVIPGPRPRWPSPGGELLLAHDGSTDLSRFDLADPRGRITTGMTGRVEAITTGRDCAIWALTDTGGTLQLWRGERDGPGAFQQATLNDLAAAVDRTSLTVATGQGFCLVEPGPTVTRSIPASAGTAAVPHVPGDGNAETAYQLLTTAIDSGQPRCRWHRVRVDADIPAGTSMLVAVATSEDPTLRGYGGPATTATRGLPNPTTGSRPRRVGRLPHRPARGPLPTCGCG